MAQKVNIISISRNVFDIFSVILREKEWIATPTSGLAMTEKVQICIILTLAFCV
jgi:hypothetical protein